MRAEEMLALVGGDHSLSRDGSACSFANFGNLFSDEASQAELQRAMANMHEGLGASPGGLLTPKSPGRAYAAASQSLSAAAIAAQGWLRLDRQRQASSSALAPATGTGGALAPAAAAAPSAAPAPGALAALAPPAAAALVRPSEGSMAASEPLSCRPASASHGEAASALELSPPNDPFNSPTTHGSDSGSVGAMGTSRLGECSAGEMGASELWQQRARYPASMEAAASVFLGRDTCSMAEAIVRSAAPAANAAAAASLASPRSSSSASLVSLGGGGGAGVRSRCDSHNSLASLANAGSHNSLASLAGGGASERSIGASSATALPRAGAEPRVASSSRGAWGDLPMPLLPLGLGLPMASNALRMASMGMPLSGVGGAAGGFPSLSSTLAGLGAAGLGAGGLGGGMGGAGGAASLSGAGLAAGGLGGGSSLGGAGLAGAGLSALGGALSGGGLGDGSGLTGGGGRGGSTGGLSGSGGGLSSSNGLEGPGSSRGGGAKSLPASGANRPSLAPSLASPSAMPCAMPCGLPCAPNGSSPAWPQNAAQRSTLVGLAHEAAVAAAAASAASALSGSRSSRPNSGVHVAAAAAASAASRLIHAEAEASGVARGSMRASSINRRAWSVEEDETIRQCVQQMGMRWRLIAPLLPGRSDDSVRNRWKRLKEEADAADLRNNPRPPTGGDPDAAHGADDADSARTGKRSASGDGNAAPAKRHAGGGGHPHGKQSSGGGSSHAKREPREGDESENGQRISWSSHEDQVIVRAVQELGPRWCAVAARLPSRTDQAVRNRWNRLQQRARVQARTMLNSFQRNGGTGGLPVPQYALDASS